MSIQESVNKLQKNEKLILVQDSEAVIVKDQAFEAIENSVCSRKDIYNLMSEFGLNSASLKGEKFFFYGGKKFVVNSLALSDLLHLEISVADESLFTFSDLILPGYVFDWAQSNKGVVVFYGSDRAAISKFSQSFSKFRAEQISGNSLVFSNSGSSFVGNENHRIVFSSFQQEYLDAPMTTNMYGHVAFSDEIKSTHIKRLMNDVDQTSVVSLPVFWSDLGATWSSLVETFQDYKDLKLLLNNLVGFVGVKSLETKAGFTEYAFEAVPFLNNDLRNFLEKNFEGQVQSLEEMRESQGYSFNQSIQALLLKRRIILENAYEMSPDPTELNHMLTQVGF